MYTHIYVCVYKHEHIYICVCIMQTNKNTYADRVK